MQSNKNAARAQSNVPKSMGKIENDGTAKKITINKQIHISFGSCERSRSHEHNWFAILIDLRIRRLQMKEETFKR